MSISSKLQAQGEYVVVREVTEEYTSGTLSNPSGGTDVRVGEVINAVNYKVGDRVLYEAGGAVSQYFGDELISFTKEEFIIAIIT